MPSSPSNSSERSLLKNILYFFIVFSYLKVNYHITKNALFNSVFYWLFELRNLHFLIINNKIIISMTELTNTQQYGRVTYLGICFLILFTSATSFRTIVSKIYDEYGFHNLGQTSLFFEFAISGCLSVCSSFIIKKLGHQKSLFMSGLAFLTFILISSLIIAEVPISDSLKWVIVIIGAAISGVGPAIIWPSSGSYVS